MMVAPGGKLVSPDVWIWSTPSFGLPQDEHRNAEEGQVKEHYGSFDIDQGFKKLNYFLVRCAKFSPPSHPFYPL